MSCWIYHTDRKDIAMHDKPHLTVATVICKDQKFLLVQERDHGRTVYNQPAGHVEAGESIIAAAQRETLEETGWQVALTSYLGTYQYHAASNGIHYVRHCFIASPEQQISDTPPDTDIEAAIWLSHQEVLDLQDALRSPMVLRAIDDYLNAPHYPLSIFRS